MIEADKMEGQGKDESQTTLEGKMYYYLDRTKLIALRGKRRKKYSNGNEKFKMTKKTDQKGQNESL